MSVGKPREYRARPAWRNQWLSILLIAALVVVAVYVHFGDPGVGGGIAPWRDAVAAASAVAAAALLLLVLYRHYAWSYTVGAEVVESRRGIIGRDLKSIRIRDLRNINVQQGVFERIFGVGDVEFSSAGGGGIEVAFVGVTRPLELKRLVQDRQNALEAQRPGAAQAK